MARPLRPTNHRLCIVRRALVRSRWWLCAPLFVVVLGLAVPSASAQSTGSCSPPFTESCPHRNYDWFDSGGMKLNSPGSDRSPAALRGSNASNGYIGNTPITEGWLFDDPDLANDPWHYLPMTRWTRVNDFFSTGEGGIGSAFNNVWNASYTTLVAMAFTFSSFAWSVTIWLVRVMVGAPTLAAEFMGIMSVKFNEYAASVFTTGWATFLVVVAIIAATWGLVRGKQPMEAAKTIFGAALPFALILALMSFNTTVQSPVRVQNGSGSVSGWGPEWTPGPERRIHGPEWLFVSVLKVSSLLAEPVQALTDSLSSDPSNAPDQIVTCDAYVAVLEGNFIRSWGLQGDHLEDPRFFVNNPSGTGGHFASAPASAIYRWAETSNALRMRLALTVSRIWERSYAVGYGRAQFGDTIAAERAFCLIADWRTRNVTPVEQLAIWRETCFLSAFDKTPGTRGGSVQFGNVMPLLGCSLMPRIERPEFLAQGASISNPDTNLTDEAQIAMIQQWLILLDPYDTCAAHHPTNPYTGEAIAGDELATRRSECVRLWAQYINEGNDETRYREFVRSMPLLFDLEETAPNNPYRDLSISSARHALNSEFNSAQTYASALFNPANPIINDQKWALRAMHGTFASCDFTNFPPRYANEHSNLLESVNDGRIPTYPTHSALMSVYEDGTRPQGETVRVPAYTSISDGDGNPATALQGRYVKVDGRVWGLGFDGLEGSGHGQADEIITSDACAAYIFGSGDNEMPDSFAERPANPSSPHASVFVPSELGIHDDPTSYAAALNGAPKFTWDLGMYPPATAFLDSSSDGSRREYPGANNPYSYNRLGRTPEEYLSSASLWPITTELQGVTSGDQVFQPSLSSTLSGADIFQSIHGRSRAESGVMALLAAEVGACSEW